MSGIESAQRADPLNQNTPLTPSDVVLIRLDGDFAEDGTFGHRTMTVSAESVQVLETGGAVSFQIPISEIRSARNEPLVGGGRLEVTTKTGMRRVTGS